jgi:DNA polymerase III epsilon subunit-like protein
VRYIVLDVETGGLDETQHSLLEIGAVIWDNCEIVGSPFYAAIVDEPFCVTSKALKVNGIELENWQGISPQEAFDAFSAWALAYFPADVRPQLAGWNVQFDEKFLRARLPGKPFWHYRMLDVQAAASFLVAAGAIPNMSGSEEVWQYFGVQRKAERGHTADEDAAQTAKLLTTMVKFNQGIVEK